MTIGTRTLDSRWMEVVTLPLPVPGSDPTRNVQFGPYTTKSWNGADRVLVKKLVPAKIPREGYPSRPDVVNRLPNETTRAFKRRRRELLANYREAVKVWIFWNNYDKRGRPTKSKALKRVMPPNRYSMDKSNSVLSQYAIKENGYWYVGAPAPTDGGVSHVPLPVGSHYAVIEKLRRKLYGSGFHPGITAAEAPKAIVMIANAATQIRLGMKSLVRGNWRGIVRNLGRPSEALYGRARYSYVSFREGRMSLSQAWLAFQYGWRPLVNDIENATAYIAHALYGADASLMRSVSATKEFEFSQALPFSGQRLTFTRKVTKYRIKYLINDVKVAPSSQPASPASAAAVAWEILPYSFVFDWVAPVSGWLQALRTANQVTGSTVVLSIKAVSTYENVQPAPGRIAFPLAPNIVAKYEYISFDRTVSTELNPPTPIGDLSPTSIFSDWRRAANSVALLQNLRFNELDPYGFKKLLGRKT